MRSRSPYRILLVAVLACGCGAADVVPDRYRPRDDWDAYRHSLELAGLADTALGSDWIRAGREALVMPVEAAVPYVERGAFRPEEHLAVGYRFSVPRGQRVEVQVQLAAEARLYLDLFRVDGEGDPSPVASAPADEPRLQFEPRQDGDYVLRVQPELLRGGDYDLSITTVQALEFPVAGHGVGDIQSVFGAPRDAGRRSHHGVDIFAPRGTPVVAATHATVSRVQERDLGGKVVWLRDSRRNVNIYYAHLDAQEVREGQRVEPGDVIGRVGNTGNARTTPPHLHFGLYFRGEGPYDPDPYLRPPRGTPPRLRVDPSLAGRAAVTTAGAVLSGIVGDDAAPTELAPGEPVRIEAATGRVYRVRLADRRTGFLGASALELPADASAATAGGS